MTKQGKFPVFLRFAKLNLCFELKMHISKYFYFKNFDFSFLNSKFKTTHCRVFAFANLNPVTEPLSIPLLILSIFLGFYDLSVHFSSTIRSFVRIYEYYSSHIVLFVCIKLLFALIFNNITINIFI